MTQAAITSVAEMTVDREGMIFKGKESADTLVANFVIDFLVVVEKIFRLESGDLE